LLEPQKRFKGVTVKKFYDKERIVCSISPNRLKQVLLNLLLNAADAMNGSGVVEIKTYRLRDTGVIEIKDYGKGIPESDQYKIWDPFFTTKPPGEGTGLGLFMCYQIIKTFGGDISFASRENVGTTFTVKLQYYYEEE
jgi:two-component system NtrC family sensor kinase